MVSVNRHNYQRIDVPQDLESSAATETAHMYRLAVEDSFRRHGVNLSVDPPQTTH